MLSKSCFAISGILVVLGGIVGLLTKNILLTTFLKHRLPLTPGSDSYEGWKKIPFPIHQKFYYFNVTNPVGVLENDEKPNLVEVGPYTWRSEWVKEDVQWNPNGTLQYRERKTFWFDAENSVGSQDDVITTVNTPLMAAGEKLARASPLVKLAIALFVNALNEKVFIQRSIRELTFEGYPDVLSEISHLINKNIPIKKGRFAYMSGKNASDDGVFNVFTGTEDLQRFNEIDRWNGQKKLPWWEPDTPCANIKGTNGELIHPLTENDQYIDFFTSSFCKPWKLQKEKLVESHGTSLTRFVAGPEILQNSTLNPENSCYESGRFLLPSGGMDISRCQFGLPLVLSFPHFYAADPVYLEGIDGLNPNKTKHQFNIDIEPRVGIALGLAARAQINLKLSRVEMLQPLRNVPEIVVPIFWQEMAIAQTEDFANHLRSLIDRPLLYCSIFFAVLCLLGSTILLGLITHSIILCYRGEKTTAGPIDKTIDPDNEDLKDASKKKSLSERHISLIRKIKTLFSNPRTTWSQVVQNSNQESTAVPSAPTVPLNNSTLSKMTRPETYKGDQQQWIRNVLNTDQHRQHAINMNSNNNNHSQAPACEEDSCKSLAKSQ